MVFHRDEDLRDIRAMIATRCTAIDRAYLATPAPLVLDDGARNEQWQLLDQG